MNRSQAMSTAALAAAAMAVKPADEAGVTTSTPSGFGDLTVAEVRELSRMLLAGNVDGLTKRHYDAIPNLKRDVKAFVRAAEHLGRTAASLDVMCSDPFLRRRGLA